MRKMTKRMMQISSALGLIFSTTNSYAIDCTPTPNCASLGYTMTETDCQGVDAIKCPTDTSKLFCTPKGSIECIRGAVLFGNGLCYDSFDALENTGIGAVGVVFDPKNRLAIQLNSPYGQKLNLGTCVGALETCKDASQLSNCGTDAQKNSEAIKNMTCQQTPGFITVMKLFSPAGCVSDFCKAGKWLLPSARDLQNLFTDWAQITKGLRQVASISSPLSSGIYWSSTYKDNDNVWVYETESETVRAASTGEGYYKLRYIVKY